MNRMTCSLLILSFLSFFNSEREEARGSPGFGYIIETSDASHTNPRKRLKQNINSREKTMLYITKDRKKTVFEVRRRMGMRAL